MRNAKRARHSAKRNPAVHYFGIMGKRLYQLAVEWSRNPPGTIKEAYEVVKGIKRRKTIVNGSRSVHAARLAVTQAAKDIRQARDLRHPWSPKPGIAAKRQPEQNLHSRLALFRTRAFRNALNAARYRFDTTPEIMLTNHVEEIGVSQSSYLDWHYYSNATRYPKKVVKTELTIPATWRRCVQAQGIALLGGLLTLDATPVSDANGVRIFSASWMAQGRGYDLSVVRGFIAVGQGENYHASTPQKAASGLAKKLRQAARAAGVTDELSNTALARMVDAQPSLFVTLNDAKTVGACDHGIQNWCLSVGLDYEARRATLREVYFAYQRHPMREARAAILVALRKRRRSFANAHRSGQDHLAGIAS